MKHRLIQQQSQKLILSPQMRQYLKLLQMPILELEQAIQQELAENPVLEEASSSQSEEKPEDTPAQNEHATEELRFGDSYKDLAGLPEDSNTTEYDYSLQNPDQLQKAKNFSEQSLSKAEGLTDFLGWQVRMIELSESEKKIAEEIIGNIDENGYLRITLDEIANSTNTPPILVERVLKRVQSLDPPGVGARCLDEALLIQLRRMREKNPTAEKIIEQAMPLFKKRDWQQISKKIGVSIEEVKLSGELIMKLEPFPGRSFYSKSPTAVTPDASLILENNEKENLLIRIEIHNEYIPELKISSYYRKLLRDPKTDPETKKFLREKIQNATNFITSIDQRKSTIRKITEEIANYQKEFLQKGFAYLKPMRLKDISETIGLHESTVSRAIHEKYISTPQGTIPIKSFFSSKMETSSGEIESQKSIMEKLRKLIEKEDPKKPQSDEEIVKFLQAEGIKIARRTVAKYRDMLKILPSHLRRRK